MSENNNGDNEVKRKIQVIDAAKLDKRIPKGFLMSFDGNMYVKKPGLEWKALNLFGVGGYSIITEPVETDFEKKLFVFKAEMIVHSPHQAKFVNYGFAIPQNANSKMQNQLFHLACTRAECRVLRMATACGYASFEESLTQPTEVLSVEGENDSKPPTAQQIAVLKNYKVEATPKTQGEAKQLIELAVNTKTEEAK